MSASRLQRRACAPEPRGRGRSAVPKRTNSSVAFTCTSLDTSLHACGSISSPSSSSPSPPTSPEEEPEALDLPPDAPAEHAEQPEPEPERADHTTPYPAREAQGKHQRIARIAEPSLRRSTGARSPLSTTSTLPGDFDVP